MSPPTIPNTMRQFNFVLEAEEHKMLTELAETGEVSASEWLRQAIRQAHATSGLETMPQKIERRVRDVEQAHADFLERCTKAAERTGRVPVAAVLIQRLQDLKKMAHVEKQDGIEHFAQQYINALSREAPSLEKAEKTFKGAFNELWSVADGWLDLEKAKKK
jgi:hypothetical protein